MCTQSLRDYRFCSRGCPWVRWTLRTNPSIPPSHCLLPACLFVPSFLNIILRTCLEGCVPLCYLHVHFVIFLTSYSSLHLAQVAYPGLTESRLDASDDSLINNNCRVILVASDDPVHIVLGVERCVLVMTSASFGSQDDSSAVASRELVRIKSIMFQSIAVSTES